MALNKREIKSLRTQEFNSLVNSLKKVNKDENHFMPLGKMRKFLKERIAYKVEDVMSHRCILISYGTDNEDNVAKAIISLAKKFLVEKNEAFVEKRKHDGEVCLIIGKAADEIIEKTFIEDGNRQTIDDGIRDIGNIREGYRYSSRFPLRAKLKCFDGNKICIEMNNF